MARGEMEIFGGYAVLPEGIGRGISIAVEDDRIIGIGPTKRMRDAHDFKVSIGSDDAILCPSFIDAHMHSPQIATRGMTSDRSLLDWLKRYIWKWEGRMDRGQVRACAQIAYLEMIHSGVGAFCDYTSVRHTEEAFKVAEAFGLRGTIGKTMMDRASPPDLIEDTDAALKETERLIRRWDGKAGGRLRYTITPRFGITSTDGLLQGCRELLERYPVRFTTHCAENRGESKSDRQGHGMSAVRRLDKLGLLGGRTLLVHGVWFSGSEISIIAKRGISLAHCPGSNMMLGSGCAPIPKMLDAGLGVALGTDMGAYYNMSMFDQMRLSVLMQKVTRLDPVALDHKKAFWMATRGGAEALGLESGLLKTGMKADIAVLSGRDIAFAPHNDTVAQIVYGAGPGAVRSLICDGKVLMEDGEVSVVDEGKVLDRARETLGSD